MVVGRRAWLAPDKAAVMKFRLIALASVLTLFAQTALAHTLSAPDQQDVEVIKGDPIPTAVFTVTSTPSELPFEMATSSTFFTISRNSTTTPATITVTFDQSLSAELVSLSDTISITMPELLPEYDLQETVEVRLLVRELGAPPAIRTNRSNFALTAVTSGGSVEGQRFLRISNGGGEPLNYSLQTTYAAGQPSAWLDIFPMSGSVTDDATTHTFSVLAAALPPGVYSAQVAITGNSANSPQVVSVTLTVTEPPLLVPNPFQLELQAFAGKQTDAVGSFQILNLGGGSLTYLMTLDVPWLKIVPLQSTVSDDPIEHVISINAAGMAAGKYSTVVPIEPLAQGFPNDSVTINLTLTEPPALGASPPSVSLEGVAGSKTDVNGFVAVTSELNSLLNWTAELQQAAAWLEITPGGPAPGALTLSADSSDLAPGIYEAEVVIAGQAVSGGATYPNTLRLPVVFTVSPPPASPLYVSKQSVLLQSLEGGLAGRQTIGIGAVSGDPLSWTIDVQGLAPWLSIGAVEGLTPSLVELSADPAGLAPGLYQHTIEVSSGAQRRNVAIAFSVGGAGNDLLDVTPRGLGFDFQAGANKASKRSLYVVNSGAQPAPWSVVFGNGAKPAWLTVNPSSGAAAAGEAAAVELAVNPAGLTEGEHSSLMRVDAGDGTSRFVTVIVQVRPPTAGPQPHANPASLTLQSSAGTVAPTGAVVQLTEPSGLAAKYQVRASSFGSWLSLSATQGQIAAGATASLTIRANPTGLAAGAYAGEVVVDFTDGRTRVIPVLYIVRPTPGPSQGIPECAENAWFVNLTSPPPGFPASTGTPLAVDLEVRDACGGPVNGVSPAIEFSSSEPSIALMGIGSGRYVGTWTPQIAAQQVTVAVILPDAQPASATGTVTAANRPWIGRGGVVNGADFVSRQAVAPGSIVSLFGDALASATGTAGRVPLPTTLAQASVLVNGAATPLFAVFPQQINLQVPFEAAARGTVDVVVSANGRLTTPESLAVAKSQPAIFELPSSFDGPGRAAAINQDGTLNSTSNPAQSGSVVVIFLTGQGPLTVDVATGAAAPSDPSLARATLEGGATLDGQTVQLEFLGLTPGYVGLLQANVRLGAVEAANAAAELKIRIGGNESVPALISVKP